jgi:phage tail sheath protein FI
MIFLSPGVYSIETDLSQIVQAAGASVGCIVFASDKGPLTPQFINNDKQFLDIYGKPNPSTSLAHYSAISFLQESSALWALRVAKNAGYPFLTFNTSTGFAKGVVTYTGNTSNASNVITAVTSVDNIATGALVIGGNIPANTIVTNIAGAGPYTITMSNQANGANSSFGISSLIDPTDYAFGGSDSFIVYPVGPGAWSSTMSVSITETADDIRYTHATGTGAQLVAVLNSSGAITSVTVVSGGTGYTNGAISVSTKSNVGSGASLTIVTSGGVITSVTVVLGGSGYQSAFTLKVFDSSSPTTALESWTVSKAYQKDGFGAQQQLEEVINTYSSRIRVLNNSAITNSVNNVSAAISFYAGGAGGAITDSEINNGWDLFANADDYTVNILINGGYTTVAVHQKMEAIASSRADAFAILDLPSASQSLDAALTYRNKTLNMNSSYAALYGPDYLKYDQYSDRQVYVPPSGAVAAVFARTDTQKDPWWAPAGLRRGIVKDAIKLRYKYLQGDRDLLYSAQINYIQTFSGAGIAVFGQKTQQAMASALQSINVRRLLIVLEKSMASALKYTLFEPNDPFTRSQIVQMLDGFLADIKNRRGLYDYQVVSDDSNNPPEVIDRNELHVDVYLKPVRAAEYIRLQSVITRTGASFSELIATGGNF